MGVKLEWIGASDASVSYLLPGDEAADGQEVNEEDGLTVQVFGDDGVAFCGTVEELCALAERIKVNALAAGRAMSQTSDS